MWFLKQKNQIFMQRHSSSISSQMKMRMGCVEPKEGGKKPALDPVKINLIKSKS